MSPFQRNRSRELNSECGLRPLRAVGSKLYEPEAIGDYAYAPAGRRKLRATGVEFGRRIFKDSRAVKTH